MSFCDFHLDAYRRGERWTDRTRGGKWVDVGPRGTAKSVLYGLAVPAHLLAHGHRKFFVYFTYNLEPQGTGKLADLRAELESDSPLVRDFPGMAIKRATKTKIVTRSGAQIEVAGLSGTTLGIRARQHRPDLVVIDDPQPLTGNTPKEKAKVESRIINEILPMGERETVYQLAGTTTMYGCLMHEAVRAARGEATAPWIAAHGWRCHHWPAIVGEGTAVERSWWERKRSLRWLQRRRDDPDSRNYYALNYANDPALAPTMVGYWSEGMFVYDNTLDVVRRVLYMDPAMTDGPRSDQTAIVVAGITRGGWTPVVEYAEQGRWLGEDRLAKCWEITEKVNRHELRHRGSPTLLEWYVESNQGGGEWRKWFARRPPGVKLDLDPVSGKKQWRIEDALTLYQRNLRPGPRPRGAVVHDHSLEALEMQAMQWTPHSSRDDLLDALAGALRKLMPSEIAWRL